MRRGLLRTAKKKCTLSSATSRRRNARRGVEYRKLRCEPLEDRCLLDANGHFVFGIDVSHWQSEPQQTPDWIEWEKVAADGYKFAFCKATQGNDYVDWSFQKNVRDGHDEGVLMTAYHFAEPHRDPSGNPLTSGASDEAIVLDASDEAHHFVDTIQASLYAIDLKPALDLENVPGSNEIERLGERYLSKWVEAWAQTVRTRLNGITPVIYVNATFAGLLSESIANRFELWIADPGKNPYQDTPRTGTWGDIGKDWTFWQYSDDGSVAGVSGPVDLNVFNGDITKLRSEFFITPTAPTFFGMLAEVANAGPAGTLKSLYAQNKKYLGYVSASLDWGVSVGVDLYVDLADYYCSMHEEATFSNEGHEGDWVTVWVDAHIGLGVSALPAGTGIIPLEFGSVADPARSWSLDILSANLPLVKVEGFSWSSSGFEWANADLVLSTDIGASLIDLGVDVARFEVKRDLLDVAVNLAVTGGNPVGMLTQADGFGGAMRRLIESSIERDGWKVKPSLPARRFTKDDLAVTGVDGVLNYLWGGFDVDLDRIPDNYYPVMPDIAGIPYLGVVTEVTFQNTGNETAHYFVKVEDVPSGWLVGALDGGLWAPLLDRKIDVADVSPHSWSGSGAHWATTEWAIGVAQDGPDYADVTFKLYYDRQWPLSNVLLDSKTVRLHKYRPSAPESSPVSAVEVIDRSGSMGVDGKLGDAKAAGKQFVDMMNIGDKIGVVSYSSSARVDFPLTEITSEAVRAQARSAIDSLSPSGMTSIGAGVYAADQQLDRFPTDPARAILVMTDGWHNTAPHPIDIINTHVDSDIVIYTIGFGPGADASLLGQMASLRNGQYYYAPTSAELRQIYSSLAGRLTGQQTVLNTSGIVGQGGQETQTAVIDPSVRQARFVVDWGGSDIDLVLVAPDGTVIDHAAAATYPNVSLVVGDTYEIYTVDYPLPGEWQITVQGADVSPGGETYNLYVTVSSAIALSMSTDQFNYQTGELVHIEASVEDGIPITGALVTATIEAPAGAMFDVDQVRLYDDGAHGDGAAGDGVYANDFRRLCWTGSYTISVEAEGLSNAGIPFVRADFQSIAVSAGTDSDGDGIPDVWEDREGTNRNVNDAMEDLEPDLLTNLQEYFAGTHPTGADTDGDGFPDGFEVPEGTNPLDPDSFPPVSTPAVYVGGQAAVDEGSSLAGVVLFVDPAADRWTATVDYGDGAPLESLTLEGVQAFPISHVYSDDGDYLITATIQDGGIGSGTFTVRVNNVAPVITDVWLDSTLVNVNETVTLTGVFTDPGMFDSHEVLVEWGDGQSDTLNLAVGERSFVASHQYSGPSPSGEDLHEFMVNVTVTDDDGGSGTVAAARPIAGPNDFGYSAYDHAFETIDLVAGAPGVLTVLDGYDDGYASLSLAGNTFNYYGTTYTTVLFPNSNGLFSFGAGTSQYSNTDLSSSPSQATVAPLFDDWRTDRGGDDAVLARFDDLDGNGTSDRLIIEWNNVQHYSSTPSGVSFQAVLELNTGGVPGDIIFNYLDLNAGASSYNDGASATVGIKNSNAAGSDPLLVSYNGRHPNIGSGESILISTSAVSDLVVTVDFSAPPPPPTVIDFDVQKGATQRSYVRYVDLIFENAAGIDDLIADARVRLTRYGLDGSGGSAVNLAGVLSTIDNRLVFDFGEQGIGGNRNSNVGDGYYEIALDLDGNGSFETTRSFYRLLGDTNGDRIVNAQDFYSILGAYGQMGTGLEEDVNGDGVVNALDRILAMRSRGHLLDPSLVIDD